jgi:hypothetical protein
MMLLAVLVGIYRRAYHLGGIHAASPAQAIFRVIKTRAQY